MKAFQMGRYGQEHPLQCVEVPVPSLRDDEVLVEVHAASVNVLDVKIKAGEFKRILPYRMPLTLGHDVAGVVVRVGAQVRQFRPGDAIYARVDDFRIGTFAEFVAVTASSAAPVPAGLTMAEAASLPLVGLTAWQVLVTRARVQPGQSVFIQAGSGGVGTFAIQLARHLRARVATTTSAKNAALVKQLGAEVVVDYKTQAVETALRDCDVVLNSQDGRALAESLRVLRPGGRLVSISGPPDPAFGEQIAAPGIVKLVMRLLSARIRRQARRAGVDYAFHFMTPSGAQLVEIARLVEAGEIRPVIDRVYPFADTNAALGHVASGHATGKVVIQVK